MKLLGGSVVLGVLGLPGSWGSWGSGLLPPPVPASLVRLPHGPSDGAVCVAGSEKAPGSTSDIQRGNWAELTGNPLCRFRPGNPPAARSGAQTPLEALQHKKLPQERKEL